jgi:hypothetical protein
MLAPDTPTTIIAPDTILCAICHDDVDEKTTGCYTMSCSHKFHLSCTVSWFRANSAQICPLCRKEAEELERLPSVSYQIPSAAAASQQQQQVTITRQILDNLLRYRGSTGVPFSSWRTGASYTPTFRQSLDFYFHPGGTEPGTRPWLDATITVSRRELNFICNGYGTVGRMLGLREWQGLTDPVVNRFSNDGDGGWIRLHRETLDRFIKIQGGQGTGHKYSMQMYRVNWDEYDAIALSRSTFDGIIYNQSRGTGVNFLVDDQWDMIRIAFPNDLSEATGKFDDFHWEEFITIPQESPIITLNRGNIEFLLKVKGSPKTVTEFFQEEEWMEPIQEMRGTLEMLNKRFETGGVAPMTEEEFDVIHKMQLRKVIDGDLNAAAASDSAGIVHLTGLEPSF